MVSHWLMYIRWADGTHWIEVEHGNHAYSGSTYIETRHVSEGDVIWTVSIRPFPNGLLSTELVLLAKLRAAQITDDVNEVIRRAGTSDIWIPKTYPGTAEKLGINCYALAGDGEEEPYTEISLADMNLLVDFTNDEGYPLLDVVDIKELDGARMGHGLQTLRKLSEDTSRLFEARWAAFQDQSLPDEISNTAINADLNTANYLEGAAILRQHIARERNPSVVKHCKRNVQATSRRKIVL